MSEPTNQCKTCAHAAKRYRGGRLHLVCMRYPARNTDTVGCIDYKGFGGAVRQVLDYLKRSSPK